MKSYGEWRYSSTMLDLSTRWRSVANFTHLPLFARTHWVRGLPGHYEEEKYFLPSSNRTPASHPVARDRIHWHILTPFSLRLHIRIFSFVYLRKNSVVLIWYDMNQTLLTICKYSCLQQKYETWQTISSTRCFEYKYLGLICISSDV
jgi:hypothetical protein